MRGKSSESGTPTAWAGASDGPRPPAAKVAERCASPAGTGRKRRSDAGQRAAVRLALRLFHYLFLRARRGAGSLPRQRFAADKQCRISWRRRNCTPLHSLRPLRWLRSTASCCAAPRPRPLAAAAFGAFGLPEPVPRLVRPAGRSAAPRHLLKRNQGCNIHSGHSRGQASAAAGQPGVR